MEQSSRDIDALSKRDEALAESALSWLFVIVTWFAWGFPYTIGGFLLDKVLWPITHMGQQLLPTNSPAQNVLTSNYLSALIGISALEVFELFVIPILWYLTRPNKDQSVQ